MLLFFCCVPASRRASAYGYKTLPPKIRLRHLTGKTMREIRLTMTIARTRSSPRILLS